MWAGLHGLCVIRDVCDSLDLDRVCFVCDGGVGDVVVYVTVLACVM